MDLETLKIIDFELEYCVLKLVPPELGKTRTKRELSGPSAIRTQDQQVKSLLLYRLS